VTPSRDDKPRADPKRVLRVFIGLFCRRASVCPKINPKTGFRFITNRVYLSDMDLRKEAIRRVIQREGPEFLNDPVVAASGVGSEVIDDEEASIRAELKPKHKKRRKGMVNARRSRRR
jgi:hypothetical protein